MNNEKLVIYLWGFVTLIFVVMFIASAWLETVKIYKLSNGTEISLETGSIAEIVLISAFYYLSNYLLTRSSPG